MIFFIIQQVFFMLKAIAIGNKNTPEYCGMETKTGLKAALSQFVVYTR